MNMQIKYGFQVLRQELLATLIESPPPTAWRQFVNWLDWHWEFLCDFFWPSFWIAVAVTLFRHGG
jgi:hypothetical protein